MELFTFIETGGARERISVVELEAGVSAALAKFDGAKANCFLPKDKQKLLAVIEAGFGDMAPFNKVVRKILTDERIKHGMNVLVKQKHRAVPRPFALPLNVARFALYTRSRYRVKPERVHP